MRDWVLRVTRTGRSCHALVDQVASAAGEPCAAGRPGGPDSIFEPVLAQGLHSAAAFRARCLEAVLQDRLSRHPLYCCRVGGIAGVASAYKGPGPHDHLACRTAFDAGRRLQPSADADLRSCPRTWADRGAADCGDRFHGSGLAACQPLLPRPARAPRDSLEKLAQADGGRAHRHPSDRGRRCLPRPLSRLSPAAAGHGASQRAASPLSSSCRQRLRQRIESPLLPTATRHSQHHHCSQSPGLPHRQAQGRLPPDDARQLSHAPLRATLADRKPVLQSQAQARSRRHNAQRCPSTPRNLAPSSDP
jgi:hypothetical protein